MEKAMRLEFFAIPALDPEPAEEVLNRFLTTHRVVEVERRLVEDGSASFWAVCVCWVAGRAPLSAASDGAKKGRIDYREVLPADEFALYDRLRTLRKQQAEVEGLPPFAVFTNEQLAEMVRKRVTTTVALAAIDGIGEARLSRYGEAVLGILREGVPRLTSPSGEKPG
jgi:superfamily II DNA helicase RecQ